MLHYVRLCHVVPAIVRGNFFLRFARTKSFFTSERGSMNRFVSTNRHIFSRKLVAFLGIFAVLGLIGGGGYLSNLAQTRSAVDLADCLSHTSVMCSTNNQPTQAQHSPVTASTQATPTQNGQHFSFPRSRPKVVPKIKTVVHASAASSALKVVPTPVPTTTTTTQPTPVSTTPPPPPTNQSSVAKMIEQVFGPYSSAALRVANCESGLNPSAYNPTSIGGSHAEGVFQILYPSTWSSTSQAGSSPYNAMANIRAAYEIFARDGYNWHEWSCAS